MHIIRRPDWHLPESAVTPEHGLARPAGGCWRPGAGAPSAPHSAALPGPARCPGGGELGRARHADHARFPRAKPEPTPMPAGAVTEERR
ncbi:MAG: hypothetical protein KatS3mg118_0070 [Paracoccaceae bacterium]|nr:MAG: hypothetical protein KatS3mg118_0070 [Paracoccaceae bacterium]